MKRGRLRVFLGAAPGVGKTYTMLEEGRRLALEGRDVVIAVVETHGRAATGAMAEGLEIVPQRILEHRGVTLAELDLDAVLNRRPELALVDELAHTNAPGAGNGKRWHDVAALLEAGIDVYSTVNIQHIESLNDVVRQITGVTQQETIPDEVLRAADQIELVDLAPQALRDRLAEGNVYPAERVDAALSNYFRLGNLTALRELALLWLADEVDSALTSYRTEHGIDNSWKARERVVVALSGGKEGETLLRRGARIAARAAGGELIAVYVTSHDGLRRTNPEALAVQRELVEGLGGSFHQVIGSDVAAAIVEFARGVNATQIVIGVSRRGRMQAAFTGPGIGSTVIRAAGDIDVHIVSHAAAGGRLVAMPRATGALTVRRQLWGFGLSLVGGPLLTWLMVSLRNADDVIAYVLVYQLLVILVALVGGIWPALFTAVLSGLTLDFFFIEPYNTVSIQNPAHTLALALYIVNGLLVSLVVTRAARTGRAAAKAAAESELLSHVAGSVLRGQSAIQALVSQTREAFGFAGVRLLVHGAPECTDGEPVPDASPIVLAVGEDASLELHGGQVEASERRLLTVIAAQLEAALAHSALEQTTEELRPLVETDRVRSALLSAVGHELRRPLTAALAAVSGLRSVEVELTETDRAELLETAEQSLHALVGLITNLLDATRLEAGALGVTITPVDPEEVIVAALDELDLGPARVELDLDPAAPRVLADAGLMQRVTVNLLMNAARYSPADARVRVTTSVLGERVEIRVIDHGPGVAADRKADLFLPFQRRSDTESQSGLGLGLALSKGFTEGMGGTLTAEDTPGGGLTMVLSLPAEATGAEATGAEGAAG